MTVIFKKASAEVMKSAIKVIRKNNSFDPLFKGDIPEKREKDEEKAVKSFVKRHEDAECDVNRIEQTWKTLESDFEKFVENELGMPVLGDFKQRTVTCNVTGISFEPHSPDWNNIIVQDKCDWHVLLHELLHTVLKKDNEAHPQIKELLTEFTPTAKKLIE